LKLVDTSVAVDHLRGVEEAVDLLTSLAAAGESLVSSEVVRFELLAGVRSREVTQLELFFSALSWFPVDDQVSRLAGRLARTHRGAHSGIDDADFLIAATALLLEAEVLTLNVRHFPMITGLAQAYPHPS
jgi:predicted nucleic acid-binding protein